MGDEDFDGERSEACGGADCADDDGNRYPGNIEVCDTTDHDEDCDPTTFGMRDADGDGYQDGTCCNVGGDGARTCGNDCDDRNAGIHPDLPDICGDSIDNDCDGMIDEGGLLYRDLDNDGRGNPALSMTGSCTPGWVFNSDDCDDSRNETYLGAREMCDGLDNDCSNASDPGGAEPSEDMDGDGHSAVSAMCLGRGEVGALGSAFIKDDCNDAEPTIYTGATEICGNGVDEDCDLVADNPTQRICDDGDGDGHGDRTSLRTIMSCTIPSGTVTEALCDDCNDVSAAVYPGNREVCDRVDNDCSAGGGAAVDEDVDGDGYAAASAMCAGRGEAGVPDTAFPRTDCVDSDLGIHPGATEVCDGVDADCSSGGGIATDEDADGDHHAPTTATCIGAGESGAPLAAYPEDDCDDTDSSVHPGIAASADMTSCDGRDNDCNAATSELTLACIAGGYCASGGVCGRGAAVLQIVAGGEHTCARFGDGTVSCWGDNGWGQLGDGTTTDRWDPVPVAGLSGVVEISAGINHTCARLADGSMSCWGLNSYGQLGDGTTVGRPMPTPVGGLSGVAEIAAGGVHTCARLVGGSVRCWGSNTNGQLGDGTTVGSVTHRVTPTAVVGLSGTVALTAGSGHTCALLSDGSAQCWGANGSGQLGSSPRIDRSSPGAVGGLTSAVDIVASGYHTCARLPDGSARCWGANESGQLGDGTTTTRTSPTAVLGLAGVVDLGAGGNHTCAAMSDGSVHCWGRNNYGQLGDGSMTDQSSPVPVPGLETAVQLALGGAHTCGRLEDGSVHCWGLNRYGQLGDGTDTTRSTPTAIPGLLGVLELAAGYQHTCARLGDGSMRCWGKNYDGQLGDGMIGSRWTPTLVPGLAGVAGIGLGGSHTCATVEDGTAYCWGLNSRGQLGDGTTVGHRSPTTVPGVTAGTLAAGWLHTCALSGSGAVSCWGANTTGELGDGTTMDRWSSTFVPSIGGAVQVDLGGTELRGTYYGHSCALMSDASVSCWGENGYGQLGDGTTTDRWTPTTIPGLAGVVEIAVGGLHTCARLGDGSVRCWGYNLYGQVGDGTTSVSRTSPTPVLTIANAVEIDAGEHYTCARLVDRSLRCWGVDSHGQLGDGGALPSVTPVAVTGVTSAVALVTGGRHACARLADGSVQCWGDNQYGQIGDGTTTHRRTPALVWDL